MTSSHQTETNEGGNASNDQATEGARPGIMDRNQLNIEVEVVNLDEDGQFENPSDYVKDER